MLLERSILHESALFHDLPPLLIDFRTFRVIDNNGSRSLDRQELADGLRDFGVSMSRSQIDELFRCLDKDGSGTISFDEFLEALRVG
jgi:Ca2+-binding EF-hand superfamily protein